MSRLQHKLLPMATLSLVLVGLSIILVTLLWPGILLWWLQASASSMRHISNDEDSDSHSHQRPSDTIYTTIQASTAIISVGLLLMIHWTMLYRDSHHLAIYRFLWLPVRRCLVPLVIWIARIESILEGSPTLYHNVNDGNTSSSPPAAAAAATSSSHRSNTLPLDSFRLHVRRRYRKMEDTYRKARIRHKTIYSEGSLNLQHILPILWEHESRASPDNTLVEFIKRFLVVTLVPDGIFDLYYNAGDELVAFSFSIRQSTVWHWFMYFCKTDYAKSGIWFHSILLALDRGMQLSATVPTDNADPVPFFVNGQVHQTMSKQNAGFVPAVHTDTALLAKLYPFSWALSIPQSVKELSIWSEGRGHDKAQYE